MPIHNQLQHLANVASGSHEQKDLYGQPIVGCARLRKRDGVVYVKETVANADGSFESGDERVLTGSHYDPPFPVRSAIAADFVYDGDGDEIGMLATCDLQQFTKLPVRLFPWFAFPYNITRVHLGSISDGYDILLCK